VLLGRVEDALNVPVQAIFRQGPVAFVYVQDGAGFAQRQVELGRASELLIEITKGLAAGDKVLLREPKSFEIVSKLDASVFEMANASAPGFGGARPAMNATPPEAPTAGGPPAQGEGRRRGGGQGGPPSGGRGRPEGAGTPGGNPGGTPGGTPGGAPPAAAPATN
jgi:hypothetical protein